ncbi:fungal-specific transcription factor domain-containing protein [Hypoxylon cercidicola]|nr:fungal-specific transcription factor domain-containing protein [Hypoxylon cercidicola]
MSFFYNMNSTTDYVPMDEDQMTSEPSGSGSTARPPTAQTDGGNGNGNGNANATGSSTPGHERPAETTTKRLACNPCRDRKFAYPWPDMSTMPMAPAQNSEMVPISVPEQAPLRPASQMAMAQDPQISQIPPDPHPHTSRGSISSTTMPEATSDWYNHEQHHDLFESAMSTDFSSGTQSVNETFDVDPVFQGLSPSSYSEVGSQASSTIPAALFPRLHASFFEVFYPILPFINPVRFQAELVQCSDSIPLQALSHAIAALGALASGELSGALEACYNQARTLLELCERQENGAALVDINTLQTYVLLAVYEFRQPNFARAWMTLGRAMRLAKIMGLDKKNPQPAASLDQELFITLPPPTDIAQTEERRRTFWQIYILDTYAAMRTKSPPVFDGQVTVTLPCPCDLSSITEVNNMPSLQQVFDTSKNVPFSPFAGAIIVVYIYRRCFDHALTWFQESSYSFWDTHYTIDKAILQCRNSIIAHLLNTSSPASKDILALILRMNLAGLEIKLHELAITKAEKDKLPTALITEAVLRCQSAAMEIVEGIRIGQRLTGVELEIFRHANLFYAKSMTKAIQAFMWMLNHLKNNAPTHINALRLLVGSMKELIDAKHLRPGLLEQVDAKVAEAERSKKRPFLPSTHSF